MFFEFFFFKQKTAYEMRISDWSSDVCSSDSHAPRSARRCARRARCPFAIAVLPRAPRGSAASWQAVPGSSRGCGRASRPNSASAPLAGAFPVTGRSSADLHRNGAAGAFDQPAVLRLDEQLAQRKPRFTRVALHIFDAATLARDDADTPADRHRFQRIAVLLALGDPFLIGPCRTTPPPPPHHPKPPCTETY